MKLADKPVYPHEDNGRNLYQLGGLTYKQWLVGMLASNSNIFNPSIHSGDKDFESLNNHKNIIFTIACADAIISELEKDKWKTTQNKAGLRTLSN